MGREDCSEFDIALDIVRSVIHDWRYKKRNKE